jgi:hypothetical protein
MQSQSFRSTSNRSFVREQRYALNFFNFSFSYFSPQFPSHTKAFIFFSPMNKDIYQTKNGKKFVVGEKEMKNCSELASTWHVVDSKRSRTMEK